jgi:hypothetical protein
MNFAPDPRIFTAADLASEEQRATIRLAQIRSIQSALNLSEDRATAWLNERVGVPGYNVNHVSHQGKPKIILTFLIPLSAALIEQIEQHEIEAQQHDHEQ